MRQAERWDERIYAVRVGWPPVRRVLPAPRRRRVAAAGAGIGAAVAYFFDPRLGRRRRHLLRDKAYHYAREGLGAVDTVGRDLRNRGYGMVAMSRRAFRRGPLRGAALQQRVQAELRRAASHPRAIEVQARDGIVTLRGPVLREEAQRVREAVAAIPDVEQVEDQLEVHEHPGAVPALQGSGTRREPPRPELLQRHWAPATRLLMGGLGGALAAVGLARRGPLRAAAGAAGAAVLTRAVTNLPLSRLTGIKAGRRAVELQKVLHIEAPPEKVWEVWDNYQNFPKFMHNVRDVTTSEGGRRSHWKVAGPLGTTVQWDAEVTRREPGRVLAWRSLPGAPVQQAGIVQLQPEGKGTRVDLKLSYNPVAGAAGDAVAHLLGANPKRQLDEDMVRMKTMLETGKRPRRAAKPE